METDEFMAKTTDPRPASAGPKWESFPKVPNLLQYASTVLFYARVQVDGKNIRKTEHPQEPEDKSMVAGQAAAAGFSQRPNPPPRNIEAVLFSRAIDAFETNLKHETALKESGKQFRLWCIATVRNHWPELWPRNMTRSRPTNARPGPRASTRWSAPNTTTILSEP